MKEIFLSYSRKDQKFAEKLFNSLTLAGACVWMDRKDIRAGETRQDAIDKALHDCKIMLVIVSPNSTKSKNVKEEWQYFKNRDKTVITVRWGVTEQHYQLDNVQFIEFYKKITMLPSKFYTQS
ncbi:MAG: toll/interleukin-1 receptor domain-containing protein [Anaerolineae bacterium]|nr:toll/interleukin-1 receptor domain-containing protein [Anaerolineae bacterium]